MQIKAYLHRYSVSSSRFFIRPTQGIFVPSKIAVLKIAAFHCSFGVIHSTISACPDFVKNGEHAHSPFTKNVPNW